MRCGAQIGGVGHAFCLRHASISVMPRLGWPSLRGSQPEALGVERGHRTLVITRKGGKVVTIPLIPRTAG
jgi:hypothetical protein